MFTEKILNANLDVVGEANVTEAAKVSLFAIDSIRAAWKELLLYGCVVFVIYSLFLLALHTSSPTASESLHCM